MKDDLKILQNKVNKIDDSSEHKIMELWKNSLIPKNVIFEPINSYGLFYMLPKHNDYRYFVILEVFEKNNLRIFGEILKTIWLHVFVT